MDVYKELLKTLLNIIPKFNHININIDLNSKPYFASDFIINTLNIKFRKSKLTPKKAGQFVTLWERDNNGITRPYNDNSTLDYCIIYTEEDRNSGIFIFPKSELIIKKILSTNNKNGKRGFRVYPTWAVTQNNQAKTTQNWQTKFFIDLCQEERIIFNEFLLLYNNK